MGNPSLITTALQVDPPLVLGATWKSANSGSDPNDRQYIDNQIRGIEQHLVALLIAGVLGTWVTIDSGSAAVAPGDVLVSAGTAAGTVTRAVAAALTNAGTIYGVALTGGTPGSRIQLAMGGLIPPAITGLGTTPGFAKLNTTTGRIVQANSVGQSDFPLGYIDPAGNLLLAPFLNTTPATTVTSVWPSFGSTAGGTAVTITGTGFSGTPTVLINGVTATGVVVVNSNKITCTTGPVTAAGQVGNGVVSVAGVTGATYSYVPGILFQFLADDAPNNGSNVTGNLTDHNGSATTMNPTGTPIFDANVLTALDGSKHSALKGNGSSMYFSSSATITHANPIEHVTVEKTNTRVNNAAMIGHGGGGGAFLGPNSASPGLGTYAGHAWVISNTDLAVGAFGIVRWVLNGASTSITVANGTPATGNPGADSAAGTMYWMSNNGASYWTGEIAADVIIDPTATSFGIGYTYSILEAALHRDFGV